MAEPSEAVVIAAIEKLEAFFAGLSGEEKDVLAPLITGGVLKAVEEASADVVGFQQAGDVQVKPLFLNYLTTKHAPEILDIGGMRGFMPYPMPG